MTDSGTKDPGRGESLSPVGRAAASSTTPLQRVQVPDFDTSWDSFLFPTYHVLFPVTIFLSAFLLFQVQPIIGRYILPWFGGGPAVWTTCLLFFQACLLAGYAYAHWLGSLRNVRLQAGVHAGLLLASLAFLPLHPDAAAWKQVSTADPSGRIFLLLTVTVGGPYLLLSATAPLVQRWFTLGAPDRSPWRLYALSNFGSFLALLSYPFVFEPWLRLHRQGSIWTGLYLLFTVLCGWSAFRLWSVEPGSRVASGEMESGPRPTAGTVLFWLGLSACGSTLLVATTNQSLAGHRRQSVLVGGHACHLLAHLCAGL